MVRPKYQAPEVSVLDFDGTVANTLVVHPTAVNVGQACTKAFEQMFGSVGLELFSKAGGLKNRSPAEITQAVIDLGNAEELLASLRGRLGEFRERLDSCVPEGKGVPLVWDEADPLRVATEIFVRLKLQAFHIGRQSDGSIWPEPCSGVLQYIEALRACGTEIGILSSGHELFIKKSFELWGVECPRLLLTDDDLRGLPLPLAERTKPSAKLFDLLLEKYGKKVSMWNIDYYGDDERKDGLLAFNAKVKFFHWYNPNRQILELGLPIPYRTFNDWTELLDA